MHKVAASWLGWCRRHVIITNLLVWTLELCAAVLVWLFVDVSDAFPTTGTYIFFWLTLFAAFTAALNSVFASMSAHDSLTITNRGLELTRATQRPFLNSSEPTAIFSQSGSDEGQLQYILFQIANTGVFPADGVTVQASISYDGISNKEKALQLTTGAPPSICFPNEDYPNIKFEDPDPERPVVKPNSTARVRLLIDYNSKITGEKYITRRAYRICNTSLAEDRTAPIPEEEDYWD